MHIQVPHHTDRATARGKLESLLRGLQTRHGHMVSDLDQHWEGDELLFNFKAKGFHVKGSVEVTDTELILDGKLPLLARPFEPKMKETIEREASTHFPPPH
jgi:Putative polyhydroxyalkanoic acid system protein (PHA_gran_rgn)